MFEEADDEEDEDEQDLIASLTQDDFLVLERGACARRPAQPPLALHQLLCERESVCVSTHTHTHQQITYQKLSEWGLSVLMVDKRDIGVWLRAI